MSKKSLLSCKDTNCLTEFKTYFQIGEVSPNHGQEF